MLAMVSSGLAENWQTYEIRVNPGRVGHSFSLLAPDGASAVHLGLDDFYGGTRISLLSDTDQPLTLVDDTIGDRLDWSIADGSELRLSNWYWPENELGQILPATRQFFLIGDDRANHGFLLGQPGGAFYVAQVGSVLPGTADAFGGLRRELSSSFSPGSPTFWMIDMNTSERSPDNALDLARAEWASYAQPLPTLFAHFYMSGAEVGHTFTLHSRPSGGSEQLQSVTVEALNPSPGSWWVGDVAEDGTISTSDHTGAELIIPPGNGLFRAHVGVGMEFWLTRDADGASSPVFSVVDVIYPQWSLLGAFPALAPQTTRIDVRVPSPAEQWTANCYVPDGNGSFYTDTFPITADGEGALYSYDDFGQVNDSITYISGHIDLPATSSFVHLQNGSTIFYGTDAFAWAPTHAQPPELIPNTLMMSVFGWRKDHQFSVRQPDAQGNWVTTHSFVPTEEWRVINITNDFGATFTLDVGAYPSVQQNVVFEGHAFENLYEVARVVIAFNANKPYRIVDETAGETGPIGVVNLEQWFLQPASKVLAISSSRWGHDLWLRHPNGLAWKVQQHATQGNLSLTSTGAAWWTNYYWYDADVPCHDFLPWRLEDRDTGESTIFHNAGEIPDLVNWIALPTPKGLSGNVTTATVAQLSWPMPALASAGGGFLVQRRSQGQTTWQTLATVAANTGDAYGIFHYTDTGFTANLTHQYRVRYTFGGLQSAPSPLVALHVLDTDGDGLPDAWEQQYFGSLTMAASAADDSDGDGRTNQQEFEAGTNPNKADTDDDGLSDSEEAEEGTDPKRKDSDDDGLNDNKDGWPLEKFLKSPRLPVARYAVIERATGNGKEPLAIGYHGDIVFYQPASSPTEDDKLQYRALDSSGPIEIKNTWWPQNGSGVGTAIGISDIHTVFGTWWRMDNGNPAKPHWNYRWAPGDSTIEYTGDGFVPNFPPKAGHPNSEPYSAWWGAMVSRGGNIYGWGESSRWDYDTLRDVYIASPGKNAQAIQDYAFDARGYALAFLNLPPPNPLRSASLRWPGIPNLHPIFNDRGDVLYHYDGLLRAGIAPPMPSPEKGDYLSPKKPITLPLDHCYAMTNDMHVLADSGIYAFETSNPPEPNSPKWKAVETPRIKLKDALPNVQFFAFNQGLVTLGVRTANAGSEVQWTILINDHEYLLQNLLPAAWELAGVNAINDQGMILATAKKILDGSGNPIAPSAQTKSVVVLVPVEIKATSHGLPPLGSIPKYNKSPRVGSVDNLISVWPAEELMLTVELPEPFKSNPPAGLITWTSPGHTVPDRTTEFTFTWLDAGIKNLTINIDGTVFKVVVDVPSVGNVTQADAYAAIDPFSAASIYAYGGTAVLYTENEFGNVPRKDAMKHSYWNALCASDALVSNQATIFVTTAHEHSNKWIEHEQAFNTSMDLHNNEVGRATVHSILGIPNGTAILNDLTQKYAAGILWIWDGERPQGSSEGILSKSDRTKIFLP